MKEVLTDVQSRRNPNLTASLRVEQCLHPHARSAASREMPRVFMSSQSQQAMLAASWVRWESGDARAHA